MGGNVLKKLRSSKGASITFALLAFLVCAVISAVLLASASAAAGRVSGLAESDRRFYAVTSAAQLFRDAMNEQEFSIERVKTEAAYTCYYHAVDNDGNETIVTSLAWDESKVPIPNYMIPQKINVLTVKTSADTEATTYDDVDDQVDTSSSFLMDAAFRYVFGNKIDELSGKQVGILFEHDFGGGVINRTKSWMMSLTVGNTNELNELLVDIEAEMAADGTITLKFTNHDAEAGDKFSIQLTLVPSVNTSDNSTNPNVKTYELYSPATESNGYYVNTATITTTTKTTSIKWTVADIKKVSG